MSCRCLDASIQPVVGRLRDGSGPGGVLNFLLIAQPGVSSLCWPRLGLSLWSPRMRGLQGETTITRMNYAVKQVLVSFWCRVRSWSTRWGSKASLVNGHRRIESVARLSHTPLLYRLIFHSVLLTAAFSSSVNIPANIHQSLLPKVNHQNHKQPSYYTLTSFKKLIFFYFFWE